jgi:hypothetical protein
VSKPYTIRDIYMGLAGRLGPETAAEVVKQLAPVFDRIMYLDNKISMNKSF